MKKDLYFEDFAKEWLEEKRIYLKESTYGTYFIIVYKHVIPYWKNVKIKDITEERIQEFILVLLDNGKKKSEGGLSLKTVKDILMVLKLILKAADKKNLYIYKKLDIHFPKKGEIKRLEVLYENDKQQLIEAIQKDLNCRSLGILFCLQTGVRIGELCAIQWKDIDLTRKIVFINKTIQRISNKDNNGNFQSTVMITSPKTNSSVRTIPLSLSLALLLQKFNPNDDECFLITGKRKYLEPHTYRYFYKNFLKKHNLSYTHFHNLRHTFATDCIRLGGDFKVVSELMGHASVVTTMNLYVHPQIEEKRQCIELLSSF